MGLGGTVEEIMALKTPTPCWVRERKSNNLRRSDVARHPLTHGLLRATTCEK
jgi:hypothetical protein